MRAYNKRLNTYNEVVGIDFLAKTIRLVLPDSNPVFYYQEQLDNVELQEDTKVTLNGELIYTGDIVSNGKHKFKVEKVPGGYFPFIEPVKENFKKVD